MEKKCTIREISKTESEEVGGGANIPGVIGGVALAWEIGTAVGRAVNRFNSSHGRSLGASIYHFSHQ